MDKNYNSKRKRIFLAQLKKEFGIASLLFLALFLLSLFISASTKKPPDNDVSIDGIDESVEGIEADEKEIEENARENSGFFYKETITESLKAPVIDAESMQDLLWEFSEYNKNQISISNQDNFYLSEKIDNSLYISKIYLTFEEKLDDALKLALSEMEYAKTLLAEYTGEDKIKYERESLSMLSSIYHLMGIRNVRERSEYYTKASECIEELLSKIDANEEMYRAKLFDLVSIEYDLGNKDKVIEILKRWDEEHGGEGKELYFKYIMVLLEDAGNEERLKILLDVIEKMESAKEDYRYEELIKKVENYISSNMANN